jgi:hypothetical protein
LPQLADVLGPKLVERHAVITVVPEAGAEQHAVRRAQERPQLRLVLVLAPGGALIDLDLEIAVRNKVGLQKHPAVDERALERAQVVRPGILEHLLQHRRAKRVHVHDHREDPRLDVVAHHVE